MTRFESGLRVGVAGLFGAGNFGNEATLSAALDRLGNDYEVVVITERAAQVRAERGLPAVALSEVATRTGSRWARLASVARNRAGVLLRAMQAVRDVDAVVVAGSGPWERLGGGPFALTYELWALALAAKIYRRPYLLWNIGVEVQDRRSARWFIRLSSAWANYRSFRDEKSLQAMRQMGVGQDSDPIVADLAFGFGDRQIAASLNYRSQDNTVIVGVMTYYGEADDPSTHAAVHESYVQRTTELVHQLRKRGYDVVLIGGDEYDLPTAVKVRDRVDDDAVRVNTANTVDGLIDLMSSARAVVALRYHSLIMGAIAGVPLVGIAYGQKHQSLLTMLGSPERVRHVESFEANEVANLVEDAIMDQEGSARAAHAVAEASALLHEEWVAVRKALHQSSH